MARIAAPERDAYLARLGLEAEPPSVAALFRIHRAHVERVPYETLWIHLGERWGVGVGESVARIASQRRGGYCFHLNGALGELLRALGYDVRTHVGGVHGPGGATDAEMANHLVLTVWGMPTDANPDGTWYVDAGLGDALHEPLPLLAGPYEPGPIPPPAPRDAGRGGRLAPHPRSSGRLRRDGVAVGARRDRCLRRPTRLAVDGAGVGVREGADGAAT